MVMESTLTKSDAVWVSYTTRCTNNEHIFISWHLSSIVFRTSSSLLIKRPTSHCIVFLKWVLLDQIACGQMVLWRGFSVEISLWTNNTVKQSKYVYISLGEIILWTKVVVNKWLCGHMYCRLMLFGWIFCEKELLWISVSMDRCLVDSCCLHKCCVDKCCVHYTKH